MPKFQPKVIRDSNLDCWINPDPDMCPIWTYYAHGRQRRCQEDPVGLPSGRLEKTTRSSPHHVAQHCPTGSETTPPYAPRSSRFGSEPLIVEDDVDVWRYAIVRVACQKRRRDVCRISPKMFCIHYLVCISHFAKFCKNRAVTV